LERGPEAVHEGIDFGGRGDGGADAEDGAAAHEFFDYGGGDEPVVAELDEADEEGFFAAGGGAAFDADEVAGDVVGGGGVAADAPGHAGVVGFFEDIHQDGPEAGGIEVMDLDMGGQFLEVSGGELGIFGFEVVEAPVEEVLAHAAEVVKGESAGQVALGEEGQIGFDEGSGGGIGGLGGEDGRQIGAGVGEGGLAGPGEAKQTEECSHGRGLRGIGGG
jgi:hypothetical protein